MTFLQAPTSSGNLDALGSNCQQYNPLDFLEYQTWTTDPSGADLELLEPHSGVKVHLCECIPALRRGAVELYTGCQTDLGSCFHDLPLSVGICPATTFTIKGAVLDSTNCLFNVKSVTALGNSIGYQYSVYLNQYIAGFTSIAAVTAELAVVCQVTQVPTSYLPPITLKSQVCPAMAQGYIPEV